MQDDDCSDKKFSKNRRHTISSGEITQINRGDVFITKLDRGFYGAFRILQIGKINVLDNDLYLIAVTNYIDLKKPDISDPRLRGALFENRFFARNIPCIEIYTDLGGVIRKCYEYLGNLPLTKEEKQIRLKVGTGTNGGFPLVGPVRENIGLSAYLEWRWNNERDEMVRENEEETQKLMKIQKAKKIKPKEMISDEQFWEIISLLERNSDNEDEILLPAIKYLSKQNVTYIKKFQENLTYKLFCIDTKRHAMNIGMASYDDNTDHFSVDLFLYARCAAVARGHEFYEAVVNDPTKMPKDEALEELLSLSSKAYNLKTNKEFEIITGCDYETFSNVEGWNKD